MSSSYQLGKSDILTTTFIKALIYVLPSMYTVLHQRQGTVKIITFLIIPPPVHFPE